VDAGELQMSDLRKAAAEAASSSASSSSAAAAASSPAGDPGRASGHVPKNPSGSVDGVAAAGSGSGGAAADARAMGV
jgi:hypothetical protein